MAAAAAGPDEPQQGRAEDPQVEATEGKPEEPVVARLPQLWEQWGLLGFFAGILVGLGGSGILDFNLLKAAKEAGQRAWEFVQLQFAAQTTELGVAVEVGKAAEMADPAGIAGMTEAATGAADALASSAAAQAPALAEALPPQKVGALAEAATAAAEAATIVPLEAMIEVAGWSSLASGLGVLAGLLFDGVREPTTSRVENEYIDTNKALTPGTTRLGEDDRPASAWGLSTGNFRKEWESLARAARAAGTVPRRHVPKFVEPLVLSNEAVMEREHRRPEVPTPPPVKVAYVVLCWFIDVVFENRPVQRFWFLETVARMPYFAYTSVLHLYETLGWWRSPELRAVHAAEEDNELHHLLIMESLGGDRRWLDRFFAQHGAVAYYWLLVLFFVIDPRWSYNFSRLIEAHAVDTYGEFVDANAEELKKLPPPPIAVEYYRGGKLYMFDKFQTESRARGELRRPPCATLYDVFRNICDDEEQHVLTMKACEEWVAGGDPPVALGFNNLSREEYEEEVAKDPEGRQAWMAWSEEVNVLLKDA